MPCDPLFPADFTFPRTITNRPSLPHVDYRIGRYADFLQAMRAELDAAVELAAWTHRGADDPGIALVEAAAVVGDILSFYQEHYANQAFLRTASWRESVADLVRLTGYRLTPALSGRATLAIELRSTPSAAAPVSIRAGWPVKADLQDLPAAATFETDAELQAWPHLSRFHLYRERRPRTFIRPAHTQIELATVDGLGDAPSLAALDLKKGDQLLLMPAEAMYTTPGTAWTPQAAPQLLKLAAVTARLGRVLLTLETPPAGVWTGPVRAYRVGRSFRHFGHNAPPQVSAPVTDGHGVVTGSSSTATRFSRYIYYSDSTYGFGANYTALAREQMPLDIEVNDLAAGRTLIVQGMTTFTGQGTPVPFCVTKTITGVRGRTVQWGNLVGASTVLTLDSLLFANGAVRDEQADIRDLRFIEATSPPLQLMPLTGFAQGAFADGTDALHFYGSADEARALAQRRLHLSHADGRSVTLVCTNTAADFAASAAAPRMWPLSFDRAPSPFRLDEFDETSPTVTVFGNLVDASEGRTEAEAVLGNGDAGASFQTFALPKAPLAATLDPDGQPVVARALEVWVNGRLWTAVESLFGRGAKDEVYIVRDDAEGRAYVQFGDGETGARLPSGLKNVIARYRSGAGARGPLKTGSTPTAPERPPGFDKVGLAGIVSGGADAESADKARVAAPGRVQSLGRLVSLADHETETLALPGVVAASARFDLHHGVPAVLLQVLLAAGREAEFDAVRAAVAHAQRCQGPNRVPLIVQQALPRYVFAEIGLARDPSLRVEDVDAAVLAALGLVGDGAAERSGLFGLHARRLGAREYASRVEGVVQNVAGVQWCRLGAFGRLRAGTPGSVQDPAALTLPPPPRRRRETLPCAAGELLQLHTLHLVLTTLAAPAAGDCA